MEKFTMHRRRLIWMGIAAVLAGTQTWAGHCHHCKVKCPQCECTSCVPVRTEIKDKKHTFEVECKPICIPGWKWPWQSCCEPPPCGHVKSVKVLKKVDYECKRCGWKWEAPCAPCGCQPE